MTLYERIRINIFRNRRNQRKTNFFLDIAQWILRENIFKACPIRSMWQVLDQIISQLYFRPHIRTKSWILYNFKIMEYFILFQYWIISQNCWKNNHFKKFYERFVINKVVDSVHVIFNVTSSLVILLTLKYGSGMRCMRRSARHFVFHIFCTVRSGMQILLSYRCFYTFKCFYCMLL